MKRQNKQSASDSNDEDSNTLAHKLNKGNCITDHKNNDDDDNNDDGCSGISHNAK